MAVYEHSTLLRAINTPDRWTKTRTEQVPEKCGHVHNVHVAAVAVMVVASLEEPPKEEVI